MGKEQSPDSPDHFEHNEICLSGRLRNMGTNPGRELQCTAAPNRIGYMEMDLWNKASPPNNYLLQPQTVVHIKLVMMSLSSRILVSARCYVHLLIETNSRTVVDFVALLSTDNDLKLLTPDLGILSRDFNNLISRSRDEIWYIYIYWI